MSYLDNKADPCIDKGQPLSVACSGNTFQVMNLFETQLYNIIDINISLSNEKIIISLKFNEEVTINAQSRFRFHLCHERAIYNIVLLNFLKGNVCGSQAIINNNLELKANIDYQNIESFICRNHLLRQLIDAPEHFCFFDIIVNATMPYEAHSIDFYIPLNSHEYVGDVIDALQFNTLTLLHLHKNQARRIYLNDAEHYPLILEKDSDELFSVESIHSEKTDIYPYYLFHEQSVLTYMLHYNNLVSPTIEFHYSDKFRVGSVDVECICCSHFEFDQIEQISNLDENIIFSAVSSHSMKRMHYDDRLLLVERFMDIHFGNVAELSSIQLFFDLLIEKDNALFRLRNHISGIKTSRVSDSFIICLHVLIAEQGDEYLFAYVCNVLQRFINYNFTNMLNYRVDYKVLK
ncbi:hypothetical protein [Piscirickettsia litoralis]|nr:hypothetical protein [Piscirickettsia litoralis]